jgi:hypothetical protein
MSYSDSNLDQKFSFEIGKLQMDCGIPNARHPIVLVGLNPNAQTPFLKTTIVKEKSKRKKQHVFLQF